ncbi:hypothetical protein [Austwickia sp. TVS 96-490-7B]|uniref:hypothetical protein n=1 Tax=Austwickia sp. TVS 96-490-7B TaxID=2830843 RepID=UPI001C5951AA|nr:hypothetical protein [Austwickia sp. TVS 96-490-7B]
MRMDSANGVGVQRAYATRAELVTDLLVGERPARRLLPAPSDPRRLVRLIPRKRE